MLVAAVRDTAIRVCSSQIGQSLKMLKMLDISFASCRTSTRISELTSMYTKIFNSEMDSTATYINEIEKRFAPLERIDVETKIPNSRNVPLLLASMGTLSQRESAVAAI